jgi:hypothetical protein
MFTDFNVTGVYQYQAVFNGNTYFTPSMSSVCTVTVSL